MMMMVTHEMYRTVTGGHPLFRAHEILISLALPTMTRKRKRKVEGRKVTQEKRA
jgi:hypothetical protein